MDVAASKISSLPRGAALPGGGGTLLISSLLWIWCVVDLAQHRDILVVLEDPKVLVKAKKG